MKEEEFKIKLQEFIKDICSVVPISKSEAKKRLKEIMDYSWTQGYKRYEKDQAIKLQIDYDNL